MANDFRKMIVSVVGIFVIIILIIMFLPLLAGAGLVAISTSIMLISTSTALNGLIPVFGFIFMMCMAIVVIESRS